MSFDNPKLPFKYRVAWVLHKLRIRRLYCPLQDKPVEEWFIYFPSDTVCYQCEAVEMYPQEAIVRWFR